MSQNSSYSRRDFLKTSLLASAALPIAGGLVVGPQAKAADLEMLSTDDPMAKNLKYTEDVSKASGVPANQKCNNCQLYTKKGEKGGNEVGQCTLFLNPKVRHVYGKGWCSAWVAKPAT